MSAKSTSKLPRRKTGRPKKPYPAFPLTVHASGKWQKKIRGTIHYFGNWARRENGKLVRVDGDGWKEALESYKVQADDLHAGRTPRVASGEFTTTELCNHFLSAKMRQLQSGELSPRSFYEYRKATDLIIQTFGKRRHVCDLTANDFGGLRADMAKRWGPARLGKFVQLIRTAFKHAVDNGLIDQPVLFGNSFNKPGKATMRKHRAASDKKLFTAAELRLILRALEGKPVRVRLTGKKQFTVEVKANPLLRAAVEIAINAGLGNSDVSGLQFSHLDLGTRWLDFPREKTGLPRHCPLWNETVASLKVAIANRPKPKNAQVSGCVFLNRAGKRMVQSTERSHQDYVSSQFRTLLRALNFPERTGVGFYSIRHTFATVALQSGDRDAVRSLMGHAEQDMLSNYDETGPSDARLEAVIEHVRKWLLG